MTLDQLIGKLKTVHEDMDTDPELSHQEADRLLLEYINNEEVTKLFNDLERWYS